MVALHSISHLGSIWQATFYSCEFVAEMKASISIAGPQALLTTISHFPRGKVHNFMPDALYGLPRKDAQPNDID